VGLGQTLFIECRPIDRSDFVFRFVNHDQLRDRVDHLVAKIVRDQLEQIERSDKAFDEEMSARLDKQRK